MLLSLMMAAVCAVGPDCDIHADHDSICKCGHAERAMERFRRGLPPATPAMMELEDPTTDVLHYDLVIEIDPDSDWLGGSNLITVRSRVDDLSTFRIRLGENFDITDVRVNDAPAAWVRIDNPTIEVTLDQAYDIDQEFDVFVAYDGNPIAEGFGSINFSQADGHPMVFSLSEPWYAYSWWPAKDDNRDKATGDMSYIVPDDLVVAANGILTGVEDLGDGRLRYDWSTSYQTVTYLFSFSAAYYNTFSEVYDYGAGTMPVDFFILPSSDNSSNRQKWAKSVEMLEVFGDLYGLYPFIDEKYGIYQFGFGGGMEHQTITGQGGFSEWLTAHELAHQWWGDMLTCATWNDIWLNEGFASYSEALWEQYKPGSSGEPALHSYMQGMRPSSVNGTVYVYDAENQDLWRIFSGTFTYDKAGWVVHQLRHVVGDGVFWNILAEYRAAFEYDSATTDDLNAIASMVYGQDLTWFFDEWVYDLGAPAYRFGWQDIDVNGQRYVELYIQQVQSDDYPIFTMPLDVAHNASGSDEVEVVWNDAEAEHFLFAVDGEVTDLELDPLDWTLHTSNTEIAFVAGPPKIVQTDPAPGSETAPTPGLGVDVVFHKDVAVQASDFTLVGDNVGEVTFTMDYDSQTFTASLDPDADLVADTYTLTVLDSVESAVGAIALDGEIADSEDAASLPSGEGLAGGDAVIRFTIGDNIHGDVNSDGIVDIDDVFAILAAWGSCDNPDDCPEDVNDDDVVDIDDLFEVLANWS